MPRTLFKISLIYLLYLGINFFFQDTILTLLSKSLPFSETYYPSLTSLLFVYAFPILLGFYIGNSTDRTKLKNYIYFINLSLIAGLLYYIPFIFSTNFFTSHWFNALVVSYILLLFPFLFLIGTLPSSYVLIKQTEPDVEAKKEKVYILSKGDFIVAFGIGLTAFFLNFAFDSTTDFLIGADIYYHAPMTLEILKGNGIGSNPYFFEGANYHYSIVYFLIAYLSKFSHLSLQSIWLLYPSLCAGFFYLFFYLFTRRMVSHPFYAVLACLFILPTRQLLWGDPSIRNISYTFFAIFLFTLQSYYLSRKKKYILLSLLPLAFVITSHPEIAIHTIMIIAVFIILSFSNPLKYLEKILTYMGNLKFNNAFHHKALESTNIIVILLLLYSILTANNILNLFKEFQIGEFMIFNDIPLSLFNPIGIISFIVFMTFPFGVLKVLDSRSPSNLFLFSIALLGTSVIFFFTHIWIFYHRYFIETAYFAFAIFATYAIKEILLRMKNRFKVYFLVIISLMLVLSFAPKFIFTKQYLDRTATYLKAQQNTFELIKNNTLENDVIILDPNNILNRYIPFYSARYVFSGGETISKDQQWNLLSFCSGSPYIKDCTNRNKLASNFFNYPSQDTLSKIRSEYRINYLLVSKTKQIEYNKFLDSDLNLSELVTENASYSLYKIQP